MNNTFRSAHSTAEAIPTIVSDLVQHLDRQSQPSLAMLFASHHHSRSLPELLDRLSKRLDVTNLMGCTGESIVADDQEFEDQPCASLWTADLPEASVELTHLQFERSADGGAFIGWSEPLAATTDNTTMLMLAEPYSFPADVLLERMNQDQPGMHVIGGMASGGAGPGESKLIYREAVVDHGAIIATLRGAQVTSVVSQGCRPIGDPFVITKAEQNVIYELGGKKAQLELKAVYDRLPNRDKELIRSGLHIGRVVNEYQEQFEYGDFLIRNVTGMNQEDESLTVGDFMRTGQTVQFHVRDGTTADEDLRQMLARSRPSAAKGALLFTCNGRGSRLFDEPHHDAGLLNEICGGIPSAGFFCQGEIGPVGGKNFLHGFTASVAIFG